MKTWVRVLTVFLNAVAIVVFVLLGLTMVGLAAVSVLDIDLFASNK
jgi:hypothetical protein